MSTESFMKSVKAILKGRTSTISAPIALTLAMLLSTGAQADCSCQFKVGLVNTDRVADHWKKTQKHFDMLEQAHKHRQEINALASKHSEPCIFEVPVGPYSLICNSCRKLTPEILTRLNFLISQETLRLRDAEGLKFIAVRSAAESIRIKKGLDAMVSFGRQMGIITGIEAFLDKQKPFDPTKRLECDFTDEVIQELERMQDPSSAP